MVPPIDKTLYEFAEVDRRIRLAAGDRAGEVLAARARWETAGRGHAVLRRAPHPGPARRWLGAWLVGLGARVQGLPGEVGVLSAKSSKAVAR